MLYNFREKGLFLGGQNEISWGAQGGTGGGICPPACMLKKALSDDELSDEDESDEEEEIAHSVPFKCIGAAHEKNY